MDLPDPTPVLELIEGFRRSKTMFSAVALGIFDRLAKGPAAASTLAREIGATPDALERLLDGCVGLGLLKKSGAAYSNTPVTESYLRRSSPHTLTGYALFGNNVTYHLWAHLEDAIREGTHRWRQTFNLDGPIFEHFFKNDEAKRDFLMGMHGFGLLSSPRVIAAFDLSRFRRLVDLGGGTGHLATAACERYPSLRATIFDLPGAIAVAREFVGRSEVGGRIELVAGDFFKDRLPDADLFSLGRIVHDWSEEKVRALLGRIHERLPRGGALLIAEKILNPNKSGPLYALMQSLHMLVCTEGKERTLAEYEALLVESGFAGVQVRATETPLDAIFATKS